LHILELYGNPGDTLAIETIPFQMYVLLLSVSDRHANTEKLPSQLKHRVHQNNKIKKNTKRKIYGKMFRDYLTELLSSWDDYCTSFIGSYGDWPVLFGHATADS